MRAGRAGGRRVTARRAESAGGGASGKGAGGGVSAVVKPQRRTRCTAGSRFPSVDTLSDRLGHSGERARQGKKLKRGGHFSSRGGCRRARKGGRGKSSPRSSLASSPAGTAALSSRSPWVRGWRCWRGAESRCCLGWALGAAAGAAAAGAALAGAAAAGAKSSPSPCTALRVHRQLALVYSHDPPGEREGKASRERWEQGLVLLAPPRAVHRRGLARGARCEGVGLTRRAKELAEKTLMLFEVRAESRTSERWSRSLRLKPSPSVTPVSRTPCMPSLQHHSCCVSSLSSRIAAERSALLAPPGAALDLQRSSSSSPLPLTRPAPVGQHPESLAVEHQAQTHDSLACCALASVFALRRCLPPPELRGCSPQAPLTRRAVR